MLPPPLYFYSFFFDIASLIPKAFAELLHCTLEKEASSETALNQVYIQL